MVFPFTISPFCRRCLVVSFWIAFALRLLMLFHVPITDNSESRYADMARWMVVSGNWITPEIQPGVPFWAKPPLAMWVSACGIKLFGVNEFGARFFIFVTGGMILLLIYRWAREMRGDSFALIGTFILFTSPVFVVTTGAVMTDLVMAAGTTLSMVAFWNVMHRKNKVAIWKLLFFAGIAVGMLAKGPIAVVLILLPIGGWALVTKRIVESWTKVPWITGGLLAIAAVAPWYGAAEIRTPGFLDYFLVGEHFKRFLVSGWTGDLYGRAHAEVLGTIWLFAIAGLMPWSLILIGMIPGGIRSFFKVKDKEAENTDHWMGYLVSWALAPLIFFSFSRNIISTYTLTGVPAAALLLPELLRVMRTPQKGVGISLGAGMAVSLAVLSAVWAWFFFFEDSAPKHSEKRIVAYIGQAEEFANSQVNFIDRRQHSACFYGNGDVEFIQPEDILKLSMNGVHDLLVVKASRVDKMPSLITSNFREVAQIGHRKIFSEIEPPSDVSASKN